MEKLHRNDDGEIVAQSYGDKEEFLTAAELRQMNGDSEPEIELTADSPPTVRRRGEAVNNRGRRDGNSFRDYIRRLGEKD